LFRNPVHPYTKALLAAVPEPNPDRKLDFSALSASRSSLPAEWPEPFTIAPGAASTFTDLGEGHFVRVSGSAEHLKVAS